MLLAIDVGNTQTVLGLFQDTEIVDSWRVSTDPRATCDELALTIHGLLDEKVVTGVVACSTVPTIRREIVALLDRHFAHVPTIVIGPGVKTGVPLHVDNPHEVGADRVVNSLAAFERHGGPAIVVDFGTSTSLDVVGPGGEFLGGALAPGIEISVDALAERAAQLRMVELVAPARVIGKNTVHAVQSGVVYGFAGLVDGLVVRIIEELAETYPTTPRVIGTGGLAPLVIAVSKTIQEHDPDLTLHGLRLAFERNEVQPKRS